MIIKKNSERRSADVLYRVDPKKLSIKICYTSSSGGQTVDYVTTFESFDYEKAEVSFDTPQSTTKLPAYVGGELFFGTEEEAREYVKRQIGM